MIVDVLDTALWVAHFRALESARADALFRDPHAAALAGERGRALAAAMPTGPLGWSLAVKTRVFDDLIMGLVRSGKISMVINLGAGLDVRPYRLELPSSLTWIEADSIRVLQHKETILPALDASCRLLRVPCDVTEPDQRAQVLDAGSPAGDALVITEGVLPYLTEATVGALANDLANRQFVKYWLTELMSPAQLARQDRLWNKQLAASARMCFAPASGLEFFAPYRWTVDQRLSLTVEAQRLGRQMPIAAMIRLLASMVPPIRRELESAVLLALLVRDRQVP